MSIALFPSRQIAFSIGPMSIHWYGVMYAVGFLIALWLLKRLLKYRSLALSDHQLEFLFFLVFLGVVIGGRLGFVLFYGGAEYWQHPLGILAVWQGGMASHGGFIGVAIALLIFVWRERVDLLLLTDVIVVPVSIALACGRIGNFINGELYGTVTTLPWAMHFPRAEGLRHPTQIYAILKDLLNAAVCLLVLRATSDTNNHRPGLPTAAFLIVYAILRWMNELLLEQPDGFTVILGFSLSRGQLLTIPIFLLGVGVLVMRAGLLTRGKSESL